MRSLKWEPSRAHICARTGEQIERYADAQRRQFPDRVITLNSALQKLLRSALDQVNHAVSAPVPVPAPTTKTTFAPTPARIKPGSVEDVMHAWTPGLVLLCGVWAKGLRRTESPERVTCRACLEKLHERQK